MPKYVSAISERRSSAGLTQSDAAYFVGVTTNTIQNWESGKSGVKTILVILKLCAALGCKPQDLIEVKQNT